MKHLFLEKQFTYDGTQLHSLYSYLNHGLLGDSTLAWIGPCKIDFKHMVDGEDILSQSVICGSNMVHFIIEIFDQNILSAVSLQRLFACICQDYLQKKTQISFLRSGDDLYFEDKKLSISIASVSTRSAMIHFAVNISNEGTPVPTCSLEDFKITPAQFAQDILNLFTQEYHSIKEATLKVKPLL